MHTVGLPSRGGTLPLSVLLQRGVGERAVTGPFLGVADLADGGPR